MSAQAQCESVGDDKDKLAVSGNPVGVEGERPEVFTLDLDARLCPGAAYRGSDIAFDAAGRDLIFCRYLGVDIL